jgi:hypothetical protein
MIDRQFVSADLENPYRVSWFFRYLNHIKEKISDEGIRQLVWDAKA